MFYLFLRVFLPDFLPFFCLVALFGAEGMICHRLLVVPLAPLFN